MKIFISVSSALTDKLSATVVSHENKLSQAVIDKAAKAVGLYSESCVFASYSDLSLPEQIIAIRKAAKPTGREPIHSKFAPFDQAPDVFQYERKNSTIAVVMGNIKGRTSVFIFEDNS